MKCIVTGGKGFIGSNLVDFLIESGYEVNVIDIDQSGYENPNAKYFYNDITKPFFDPDEIFEDVDVIFHMAAEIYIQKSLDFPNLFNEVNTYGTDNILFYARKYSIKNIIVSSTSAIYGNDFYGRGSLEYDIPNCLNAYSESKYKAEEICKEYVKNFNINITVLRYFNVYGNRQHETGQYAPVIGKFLRQKNNGESLTVVGDGLQKRDFVNVDDVVIANYLAYKNAKDFNLYNIGSGENISIIDLAKLISEDIVHIDSRDGECKETLADITLAKEELGWNPTVFVKDYLNNYLSS